MPSKTPMEKVPPVIRDICGTESGYRKHRRQKEHWCLPCNEAHRIHRKQYATPEKNAKYKHTYKRKADPDYVPKYKRRTPDEIAALREQQSAAQQAREEAKAAKAAQRLAEQEKARQERAVALEAQKAETAARNAAKKLQHQADVAKRAKQRAAALKRKKARLARERKEALRLANKAKRDREKLKKAKAAAVAKKKKGLANQHGVTLRDYTRCKKNNGEACGRCKAFAAKYAREYRKANPERAKTWSKGSKSGKVNNRKRLKPGAHSSHYTRDFILKRDRHACYLCGLPVDLTASHVQGQPGWELYPHLDHVVPLSRGGDDTPANVRTTHAKCNYDKRDMTVKEYRNWQAKQAGAN